MNSTTLYSRGTTLPLSNVPHCAFCDEPSSDICDFGEVDVVSLPVYELSPGDVLPAFAESEYSATVKSIRNHGDGRAELFLELLHPKVRVEQRFLISWKKNVNVERGHRCGVAVCREHGFEFGDVVLCPEHKGSAA